MSVHMSYEAESTFQELQQLFPVAEITLPTELGFGFLEVEVGEKPKKTRLGSSGPLKRIN